MTKEAKQPTRLQSDPIIESLFEIRFKSHMDTAADILPGLLYQSFRGSMPKTESMPNSAFQRDLVQHDANFTYKPSHRIHGPDSALLIGDRMIAYSFNRPYKGWIKIKSLIDDLLKELKNTGLIVDIERFSIKYVNAFSSDIGLNTSEILDFSGFLGRYDLGSLKTQIRTEIFQEDFRNIVQVVPNATLTHVNSGQESSALILDIDTIFPESLGTDWSRLSAMLEQGHSTEKDIFFSIVSEKALAAMSPIWEAE